MSPDHAIALQRQQQSETPSQKIRKEKCKKLTRPGGTCLWSQLLRRLRQEDRLSLGGGGCSELRCVTAIQPG